MGTILANLRRMEEQEPIYRDRAPNYKGLAQFDEDSSSYASIENFENEVAQLNGLEVTIVKKDVEVSPTSAMVTFLAGTAMYKDFKDLTLIYTSEIFKRSQSMPVVRSFERYFIDNGGEKFLDLSRKSLGWRKAFAYQRNREFLQSGVKQMVLMADGINPMVVALAKEYPDTQFYCTDYDKDIIRARADILRQMGFTNIHCLYHDVKEPENLPSALEKEGFDATQKAVANMEGILCYLEQDYRVIETFLKLNPTNKLMFDYEPLEAEPVLQEIVEHGWRLIEEFTGCPNKMDLVDPEKVAQLSHSELFIYPRSMDGASAQDLYGVYFQFGVLGNQTKE